MEILNNRVLEQGIRRAAKRQLFFCANILLIFINYSDHHTRDKIAILVPLKPLSYILVYSLPVTVLYSMNREGLISFLPLVVFFVFVPLLELFLSPDHSNLKAEVVEKEKGNRVYDWVMFMAVPIQLSVLIYFLIVINTTPFGSITYFGRIVSMGLMCGVMGINIGHELGHRSKRLHQFLGEILLLTSLNTHFLPYHNLGHHYDVATPLDSATAKKNQLLYTFWFTSHFGSYIKAWQIENKRMKKNNTGRLSFHNKMVVYTLANIILLSAIFLVFNLAGLIAFVLAATGGILLLETVNYIEHYGLLRKKNPNGRYERVQHHHSWNSDHPIGRLLLFNLSRHSNHHYRASKKYQILESMPESPQMFTGYPGMMVLAFFQPLWFYVMNKKLTEIQ